MAEKIEVPPVRALMSTTDVMAMLGIKSRTTLSNLLNNKKDPLPSIRFGQQHKFQVEKVLWWIEKHEK